MTLSDAETRVQFLQDKNFNEGKVYRLRVGWLLRLQAATHLAHMSVRVFSNMPPDDQKQFERNTYYEYAWKSLPNGGVPHDNFNDYVELTCRLAGCFHYYFTLSDGLTVRGGSNFLVDPELKLADGKHIDLNSLNIHTVLAKQLGSLNEWKSRLEVRNLLILLFLLAN